MLRATPRLASDEAGSFEREDHLVNRRWADAEVVLHVGFGRRPAEHARVGVDEGQILALLFGEGLFAGRRAAPGFSIHLSIRPGLQREEAEMNVRYRVELSQAERGELTAMLSGGKHAARKLKRAQILLAADAGGSDEEIARSVAVGGSTVYRTKRRFVEGNLERALSEEPRPGAERKLTGKEEALLVATACASPPEGRARWTLELLAGEMVKLTEHESLSRETVRRRLAENDLKPWRKDMWCIPQVDGEYVARMEDVLDLYAEAPDPKRPVVCFDESPIQLIGEVRQPIPAEPGQLERYDYEYRRNGTVNLFVCPRRAPALAQGQGHRAARGRGLRPMHARTRRRPLSRCRAASGSCRTICRPTRPAPSIEAFPPAEARRILRRLEFHYTPKHASWLNMVEIEIGVLRGQCLDRRIDDRRAPRSRNRRLGTTAQRRRRSHQMDVHNRKGPRQNGPRLSRHVQRVIITVQRY